MNCIEIQDRMLDLAAGIVPTTVEEKNHLAGCGDCAAKLLEFRKTMALLDEWKAPEVSPYFDTRLNARLREEMAKPERAGWLAWFTRPVLATAMTLVLAVGVGIFVSHGRDVNDDQTTIATVDVQPGSAVSDLSTLDNNPDMYSDFELLDDLQVQQDEVANP